MTTEIQDEWNLYAASGFEWRYCEFHGRAESLRAALLECSDDAKRAKQIDIFVILADQFLCELRSRADVLKREKTRNKIEEIDISLNGVCESLLRLGNERLDEREARGALSSLMFGARDLYFKVAASRNAKGREGYFDCEGGCWKWNENPKQRKDTQQLDRDILELIEKNGWMMGSEVEYHFEAIINNPNTPKEILENTPSARTVQRRLSSLRKRGQLVNQPGRGYGIASISTQSPLT